MIPKIIHYCWFGKGVMPKSQRDCIKGWKRLMPDYQIIRWDESNFDLEKFPLANYACQVKKYALASDVCRYNVLAEYGGIYLDTDVELFQRFDAFLDCNFFSGIELYREFETEQIKENYLNEDGTAKVYDTDVPRLEILTSTMGCNKGNGMICQIRDYYNSTEATPERALHYRDWVNNDRLVARYLTHYGFRYEDRTQQLDDNMVVYGTGIFGYAFAPNPNYSVSYHHNAATWESERWNRTQRMSYFFDKLGVLPVYKKYKQFKKKIRKRMVAPITHPVVGEIWCLHRVLPKRSCYPSNRELEITPDYLEQLIQGYKKDGYSFVSLDTFLRNDSIVRRKFINVSFDDGFKDVYEYAFPILKKYQVPFTVYLTTDMPDGKADLWWIQMECVLDVEDYERMLKEIYASGAPMDEKMHELTGTKPDFEICRSVALTWVQLNEMVDSGLCTMGSHTVSHPGLDRIGQQECISELLNSRKRIKEMLSVDAAHFSYPHSMKNEFVQKAVAEAGYVSAVMGYGGSVKKSDDLYQLNRKYIIQEK